MAIRGGEDDEKRKRPDTLRKGGNHLKEEWEAEKGRSSVCSGCMSRSFFFFLCTLKLLIWFLRRAHVYSSIEHCNSFESFFQSTYLCFYKARFTM